MKILILGGTGEARELADRLVAQGHAVTTSLAGRTRQPVLPAGDLRVGRFGGVPGLASTIDKLGFTHLVDATHPYARLISSNAAAAARQLGIPLLRLVRAPWPEPPGADWRHVADVPAAAQALPSGAKALITSGHEALASFYARTDCRLIVRLIEAPEGPVPPHIRLLLARPPYALDAEKALFRHEGITHLVSKNSGGAQTEAKLEAARAAHATIIMVARPRHDPAHEVPTVEAALAALYGEAR